MLRSQISNNAATLMAWMLLICFASCVRAESEKVISFEQIKPDKACGPRCLWAFMQVTGAGRPDCGLKCIYELIGRKPFSATSLKDLKDAAQELGFSANGYKLTVRDLEKMAGYAILPVGHITTTGSNILHFILVKQVAEGYVIVVDTETLKAQAITVSELQKSWNGYALVISAGKGTRPLRKNADNIQVKPEKNGSQKYDQIKNFGHVDGGSMLEHTFTIPNGTNGPCETKIVSKSCSCVTASLGRDTKGRTTLTMELRVDRPAWQEAHVAVSLEPPGIIKRYALRAYGKDTFRITPAIGHIEAPDGGVIEYPVRIDYFTDANDIAEFDHLKSSITNLKAGPVKSENFTDGSASRFSFQIPLVYDTGAKLEGARNIKGGVNFVLNTGKGQRIIPLKLTAKIGIDRFRLTPEKIFIIASKSAELIQKKAKVEFLTVVLPSNIVVKSDDALPLQIKIKPVSKSSYMINMTVAHEELQKLSPKMHKGEVVILPEGMSDPDVITLPVSLFVRQ